MGDRLVRLPANPDDTVRLKPLFDFRPKVWVGVDPAIPGSDKTVVWYDEAATVTRKAWGRLTDD